MVVSLNLPITEHTQEKCQMADLKHGQTVLSELLKVCFQ